MPGESMTSLFEMLEPSAGKLACSVLRGAGGSDAAGLPDPLVRARRDLTF